VKGGDYMLELTFEKSEFDVSVARVGNIMDLTGMCFGKEVIINNATIKEINVSENTIICDVDFTNEQTFKNIVPCKIIFDLKLIEEERKMERVKIELFRYETLVFGQVVSMDEEFIDSHTKYRNGDFRIESANYPALYEDRLCLLGNEKDKDGVIFHYDYESKEAAIFACENIKKLIDEINEKPKEDEVESKIIKIM
jgi:hypothetical protein